MTRTERAVSAFQIRHNDRLLQRIDQPDDGRPTRAQSACIALACAGLVLLVAWVSL